MTQHERLEGKVVIYSDKKLTEWNKRTYKAKVVGLDPHIGATLVDSEDSNSYFFCIRGPSSPSWQRWKKSSRPTKAQSQHRLKEYNKIMKTLIKQIETGVVCREEIMNFQYMGDGASAETCAFN